MGRNGVLTLPAWTRATMIGVWGGAVIAGGPVVAREEAASGGAVEAAGSRSFITSDGARLHDLEAGPIAGPEETVRTRMKPAGMNL